MIPKGVVNVKRMTGVARLIADLDKWVVRPINRELLLEQSTRMLHGYLSGKLNSPHAHLSGLATWHGHVGAHHVLRGYPSGWGDIAKSHLYLAWNERTLMARLDRRVAKSVMIDRSVFVLLHAIGVREDVIATWFGERLVAGLRSRSEKLTGWASAPLYPFALHLYAKWKHLPPECCPGDEYPLGGYRDLLDAWDSEDEFAARLADACDYHVAQAFDDSEDDTQDFFAPLYDLFPVEILAIRRIRREQGLPMPAIDHPLLRTPLASPPVPTPTPDDELLRNVSAKVCEEYGLGDPWA